MQLHEIEIGKTPRPRSSKPETDDLILTQYTDLNLSPAMAELIGHLTRAESFFEVRAILNTYMPELQDGTVV